jgi:hypothetical protein
MPLRFNAPGADTPGFLKRQRQALEFKRQMQGDIGPEMVDRMVDYLVPYVSEPADRDEAREALMEATQTQFMEMLAAIGGGGATPLASES